MKVGIGLKLSLHVLKTVNKTCLVEQKKLTRVKLYLRELLLFVKLRRSMGDKSILVDFFTRVYYSLV